ncbi:1,2-phenylacetyl-CoA epoxidase subunit PaaD [Ralstonia sp. UBA689]|uniref:1,2-phenylacetyl-CoA epoxidase subunit PaaD n=1 Tax=Ralstonia sp. UBA689 TaxID=1947373 RepID=UPI0025D851EB|nr:1,2-phenylacetyl-CoA epoxidase subunit PaaD [Ralstonia sp. UBA689]
MVSTPSSIVSVSAAERVQRAWNLLGTVLDPEVPALSIRDLGIVRDVCLDGQELEIVLTPTYSGCPATEAIERSVLDAIDAAGLGPSHVRLQRAPAWTTDWISEDGRRKLREYGIAPPGAVTAGDAVPMQFVRRRERETPVSCPRCGSVHTERLSAFGSTACKALYRCLSCREPFEHFKPI